VNVTDRDDLQVLEQIVVAPHLADRRGCGDRACPRLRDSPKDRRGRNDCRRGLRYSRQIGCMVEVAVPDEDKVRCECREAGRGQGDLWPRQAAGNPRIEQDDVPGDPEREGGDADPRSDRTITVRSARRLVHVLIAEHLPAGINRPCLQHRGPLVVWHAA
jgi:hypothetical protein